MDNANPLFSAAPVFNNEEEKVCFPCFMAHVEPKRLNYPNPEEDPREKKTGDFMIVWKVFKTNAIGNGKPELSQTEAQKFCDALNEKHSGVVVHFAKHKAQPIWDVVNY